MVKGQPPKRWLKITIEHIKAIKHHDREVPKILICESKTTWHQLVTTFFQNYCVMYQTSWHFVTCYSQRSCVRRDFSWPLPTQESWQPCIPVSMYIRSFPWSRDTWWPRCSMSPALLSLSPCSVWELCNHHKATQVSALHHKWRAKQHLLRAGAPKEACIRAGRWIVPPRAASLATRLPLPFFLPERLTGTGTFQRKKSQSNSWREFVLFLLLVESYKKRINMFYSLGSHWHLMESCKNVLENNSTFLFCSAFYFLKLLKIAAQGNSYYSALTYLLHMEQWGHTPIVISTAATYFCKSDIIQDTKKQKRTRSYTSPVEIQETLKLRDWRKKTDTINGNMPRRAICMPHFPWIFNIF